VAGADQRLAGPLVSSGTGTVPWGSSGSSAMGDTMTATRAAAAKEATDVAVAKEVVEEVVEKKKAAEVAAKKKATEEAAARKKVTEETVAKKKATEEAAAKKMAAEEAMTKKKVVEEVAVKKKAAKEEGRRRGGDKKEGLRGGGEEDRKWCSGCGLQPISGSIGGSQEGGCAQWLYTSGQAAIPRLLEASVHYVTLICHFLYHIYDFNFVSLAYSMPSSGRSPPAGGP
jgi:hypothetical protein